MYSCLQQKCMRRVGRVTNRVLGWVSTAVGSCREHGAEFWRAIGAGIAHSRRLPHDGAGAESLWGACWERRASFEVPGRGREGEGAASAWASRLSRWEGWATMLYWGHWPSGKPVRCCWGKSWWREFSMVSAELLAQLELQRRELMQDVNLARYSSDGRARPFGGLNVILPNDLYQLPLPKGTFLGDIPWELVAGRKATKQATALHGQTLLWGGPDAGMQGVTELVLCERTSDCKGRRRF